MSERLVHRLLLHGSTDARSGELIYRALARCAEPLTPGDLVTTAQDDVTCDDCIRASPQLRVTGVTTTTLG